MSHQSLLSWSIPVAMRFGSVHNLPHLMFLPLRQVDLTRSKVLFKTLGLGSSRNRDHTLSRNPSKCNLTDSTTFALSQSSDLLNDCFVLVEILALEFRDYFEEALAVLRVESLCWTWKTDLFDGNHSAQSHLESCSRNCLQANRVPEDCRQHMRLLALCKYRSDHLSREVFQRQSTLLELRQSWRLI